MLHASSGERRAQAGQPPTQPPIMGVLNGGAGGLGAWFLSPNE